MVDIPDVLVPSLKIRWFGTIFSAVVYGIVVVLSGKCFHLLYKKRGIYSTHMRSFLFTYITVMLLLSTWMLIQSVLRIFSLVFLLEAIPFMPITLPLTIWGAHGFMIWCCFVLYQDISQGLWVVIIDLLSLLSFTSFELGIMTILHDANTTPDSYKNHVVITLLSTLVNNVLVALIVFRVVYHRRRRSIQHVLEVLEVEPELGSDPNNSVMAMCIESSVLFVISSAVLSTLTFMDKIEDAAPVIMYSLLPHICVISPLFIIYHVAIADVMPSTVLQSSEKVTAQSQFESPLSNPNPSCKEEKV